jgi:acyl-CoA thioesterase I
MNATQKTIVMTEGVPLGRRRFMANCIHAGLAGAAGLCSVPAWANPKVPSVLIVGNSLSAEYGLKRGTGWVALLEQRAVQERRAIKVVNASISGETTSGGRSRLPALLALHRPQTVLIELGGNDALRGLPLNMTRDNLLTMVKASKAAGASVVLTGMQLPPNYGRSYSEQFFNLYAEIAQAENVALVPFLLKDVADTAEPLKLFQADRIHPNEQAHPIILSNVWPVLLKALTKK